MRARWGQAGRKCKYLCWVVAEAAGGGVGWEAWSQGTAQTTGHQQGPLHTPTPLQPHTLAACINISLILTVLLRHTESQLSGFVQKARSEMPFLHCFHTWRSSSAILVSAAHAHPSHTCAPCMPPHLARIPLHMAMDSVTAQAPQWRHF